MALNARKKQAAQQNPLWNTVLGLQQAYLPTKLSTDFVGKRKYPFSMAG
jgi:hypothetical protein